MFLYSLTVDAVAKYAEARAYAFSGLTFSSNGAQDGGTGKVYFERQAHHFPAASNVAAQKQAAAPTEKAAPKKHRLSLAPATGVAARKGAEAPTEKAAPTTRTSASVGDA